MGLDQTQPPFFPILDLEMDRIMADRPFAKGGLIPNPSAWPPQAFKVSDEAVYISGESLEPYSAVHPPIHDTELWDSFLRTWAANIADDIKEPSQDA